MTISPADKKGVRGSKGISYLYLLVFFLSCYFLAFNFERLMVLLGSLLVGFPVSVNYFTIKFYVSVYEWDQESVLALYLLPKLLMVLAALAVYFYLVKHIDKRFTGKYFLFVILFFMVYRLTALPLFQVLFHTGIYHSLTWLYLNFTLQLIISSILMLVFFGIGLSLARKSLAYPGIRFIRYNEIEANRYSFWVILAPFLTGSLIILLYFYPHFPPYELLGLIPLFALTILIYYISFYSLKFQHLNCLILQRKHFLVLVLALLVMLSLRVILKA